MKGTVKMTDRTISLSVTLDNEYRTYDAEFIVNAIKMIKGVLDVTTIKRDAHFYKSIGKE